MSPEKLDPKFDPLGEDPKFVEMQAEIKERFLTEGFLLKKESAEENMISTTIEGELNGREVKFERVLTVTQEEMMMQIILEYGEEHKMEISWLVDSEGNAVIRGGDNIQRDYLVEEFNQYESVAYDMDEKDENDEWFEKMKESYPMSPRKGLRCMTLNQWKATEQRYTKWTEMKEGLKEVKKRLKLNDAEYVRTDYAIFTDKKDEKMLKMNINGIDIEASVSWSNDGEVKNRTLYVDGREVEKDEEKRIVDKLFKEYQDVAYCANEEDLPHVKRAGVEYKNRAIAIKDAKLVNKVGSKVLGQLMYDLDLIEQDGELEWVSNKGD